MPALVRLYIRHVIYGFGLSAVFVALLLWQNVGNLGHLIAGSDKGWIAVWMLFIGNGVVFAGVQFAWVVMRMADSDDTPGGGKRDRLPIPPQAAMATVPVPVIAGEKRRDRHDRQGFLIPEDLS